MPHETNAGNQDETEEIIESGKNEKMVRQSAQAVRAAAVDGGKDLWTDSLTDRSSVTPPYPHGDSITER